MFIRDTRDKIGKHDNVDNYLREQGHKIVRSKLFVGDVSLLSNQSVCIDLKRDLQEICGNVCQQHERFKREILRANECGIHMIFLCEHGGKIKSLNDVQKWDNPRLAKSPMAVSGERLFKILSAISSKYGVEFVFCSKAQTGKMVENLLLGG